jgi:hypothetical protein
MAAGRGGLVATARNALVNFGFQEAWKKSAAVFQALEKQAGDNIPDFGKSGMLLGGGFAGARRGFRQLIFGV